MFLNTARWLAVLLLGVSVTSHALTVGEIDTTAYGWKYGTNAHKSAYSTTFDDTGVDLELRLDGFDIDIATEVQVKINATAVGYLRKTANNQHNNNRFVIPASLLNGTSGSNTLEYIQISPGYKWGVKNQLLEASTPNTLLLDTLDATAYGWYYGTDEHKDKATFTFAGNANDVLLTTDSYDIDTGVEVSLYLNDQFIRYLPRTANASTGTGGVLIPASWQLTHNVLEFRQANPGVAWGISNVLIASYTAPALALDTPDTNAYGWRYGSDVHKQAATFTFAGGVDDYQLTVTGYDIDSNTEVGVYLNDTLLQYLHTTPNAGLSDTTVVIPASQMQTSNVLEFRQTTPGVAWGVTDLQLTLLDDISLTFEVTDTGAYGWKFGSKQHRESLSVSFAQSTHDLVLSLQGYDIDNASEVAISLNGQPLDHLSITANAALGRTLLHIPATSLITDNTLTFTQANPGYAWGVTDLLLQQVIVDPPVALALDSIDTQGYGFGFGQAARLDVHKMTFDQVADDLELTVTAHDMDRHNEVSVWLNDVVIGHLPPGDNESLTRSITFLIPQNSQLTSNTLEFKEDAGDSSWGIDSVLLSVRPTGPAGSGETEHTVSTTDDLVDLVHNNSSNGDVFRLLAGVHRLSETIYPKHHQRFYCETGAVISGAVVLTGTWTDDGGTWSQSGAPLPIAGNGGMTPGFEINTTRNDLFIDDVAYLRVASLAEVNTTAYVLNGQTIYAGTFYQDEDIIHIGFDPGTALVEMSDTRFAFQNWDLLGDDVTFENCVIEKFASDDLEGAIDGKYTRRWYLKNITGRHNHTAVVRTGRSTSIVGGSYVLNGQPAITGQLTGDGGPTYGYSDNVLVDNIELAYNTWIPFDIYWHSGGAKLFATQGLIVRNSEVHHNFGPGLWSDWDVLNVHFDNNHVHGNTSNGIKVEVAYFGSVNDNLIECNSTLADHNLDYSWFWGSQLFMQNAQGIDVKGNTIVSNYGQGIGMVDNQDRGANAVYGLRQTINNSVTENTIRFSSRTRTDPEDGINGIETDYGARQIGMNASAATANNVMDYNAYEFSDATWQHFKYYQHFYEAADIDYSLPPAPYPPEYAGVAWDVNYEQNSTFTVKTAAELAPATLCP